MAIGAMGTDTPLAALSDRPKLLYNYFQQLFAQVTNPPIDSIREAIITSAQTTIGCERNLLKPEPESCHLIELKTPVLSNAELAKLKYVNQGEFKSITLPILFAPTQGVKGLETVMDQICAKADEAIANGVNIIILSDRGVDQDKAPIPALLAVSGARSSIVSTSTPATSGHSTVAPPVASSMLVCAHRARTASVVCCRWIWSTPARWWRDPSAIPHAS